MGNGSKRFADREAALETLALNKKFKKKKKAFDSIMEKGVVRSIDMSASRFYKPGSGSA